MKRILLIILTLAICLPVLSGCTPKQFKNLNESDIKSVSVSTLPEFYGYEYSFSGDEARAVVDYLSGLNLTPHPISVPKGGMTWVIEIEYEDESETTVYLFGDEIWINANAKYIMQPEERGVFEALIGNLNQNQ
ncbi:MAG: hypothetical protein IKK01_06875 [Clostridia bacterium]|nr:hypothetical protein [Clostridia bacterium]